jgi:DNA-binding NarL/FixJ family response regulator
MYSGPTIDLTPRRKQVLRLVAKGLSNSDIARALTIELATVESHLHTIYGLLGVRNRVEAAVTALQSGLLEDDEGAGGIQEIM